MGTVVHRKVAAARNGRERGELEVESDWVMPDGSTILRERTRFVFHAPGPNARAIDRITTLTAQDKRVLFRDNKEGVLGLRVTRALEHPTKEPLIFTDASGRPTTVASRPA